MSPVSASSSVRVLALLAAALVATACGRSPAPEAANPPPEAAAPDVAAEAATPPDAQAEALAAREAELANREQELALKEREADLARREAELAARQTAAKSTAAAKPAAAPAKMPAATAAAKPKPAPPAPITLPAGTQFSVELTAPLSTKSAHKNDRVDGRLAADIVVDGRKAVSAGAAVEGKVTEVVSGSQKIGGTPLLGISFNRLALADGSTVAIAGTLAQKGKKETNKDAAKIAGGAVVGAILGRQVGDDKKGTIIGAIVGGAAGAAIAKNTGGEVELPAGTVIGCELTAPVEVKAQ